MHSGSRGRSGKHTLRPLYLLVSLASRLSRCAPLHRRAVKGPVPARPWPEASLLARSTASLTWPDGHVRANPTLIARFRGGVEAVIKFICIPGERPFSKGLSRYVSLCLTGGAGGEVGVGILKVPPKWACGASALACRERPD